MKSIYPSNPNNPINPGSDGLWFGVMVTHRSHKPEEISSNLIAATNDDLAQLAERYPDTVEVDGSSLSIITDWFVTQLDQSTGLLHREL
jgi:hypothetical protein